MASNRNMAQVQALVAARRFAEAARLLAAAAGAGEAAALAELARWRIVGDIVRRDLEAARSLLGRAGAAGDTEAALLHACFLASGTGGPPDWAAAVAALRALAPTQAAARAQLALLDRMDIAADGAPAALPTPRLLSDAPEVAVAEKLLTPEECAYLAARGAPTMQKSMVVDPASGRLIPHPIRSSDGTMFGVFSEDLVVNAVNRRIAALTGTQADQGEPLQLLRYGPGGEYRAHLDALPAEANQRIVTVITYLGEDYGGGETHFPRIGLSFRGRTGDAILFRNVDREGRPDPLALHAGLPVTRGTKLIATRWIRRARFTYPPPQPLLAV